MQLKLIESKHYYDPEMSTRPARGENSKTFAHWYLKYGLLLSFFAIFILWYYLYSKSRGDADNVSWDFLLFTQSFPITCCIWNEFEKQRTCHFAPNPHTWTIHGIWPTKNTTEGPIFCHNLKFDKAALEPIKTKLEIQWPSIDPGDSMDFWKHEWRKHGTCAIEDKAFFDSEITYFKLGLDWNEQYNITDVLSAAGIIPSNEKGYQRQQIHDAIKSAFGKTAHLACYHYKQLGVYLINEIRLCFSKQLELLDCDSSYADDFIECPNEEIMYPDNLSFRRL